MNELRYDTIFHKIDFLQEFQVITKILLQLGASSMYKNGPKPKIWQKMVLWKNGMVTKMYKWFSWEVENHENIFWRLLSCFAESDSQRKTRERVKIF